MKIGDRVFVRGYIDEIRKDTVIIRNAGGYFGTIPSEVITGALPPAQPDPNCSEFPNNSDTISRQAAIDAIKELCLHYTPTKSVFHPHMDFVIEELTNLPSAQPERDIPVEPNETIDRTWGIPQRQPICPRCDYYLGRIYFIGDGGSHVVYCEKCGQAINLNGWDFEKEEK